MPDGIQPVGAMIKPVDPNQTVNTLSGIVGLKQQQQALQTGAFQQQAVQAEAQQAQQKNTELQKVGMLLKGVHDGGYRDKDGNFDNVKFANDVSAVAPVYGQTIASTAVSRANEIVGNQRAKQGLTEESRGALGNVLNSLATNPQTRRGDVVDAMTRYITDHKDDPNAIRVATAQLALLPPDDGTPNFRSVLSNYAGSLTGKPQATPSTVDTGTVIQPGQTSAATGAFTPAGGAIPKQSMVTTPAGPLAVATPARGTLTPLGGAPSQNLNPTHVQQQTAEATAQGVTGRVQQAQAAANNTTQAQDALTRARSILDTPNAPNTGALVDWKRNVKNLLATVGIDTQGADDINSLVKNLSRYEAARATQAGLGGTDAARELAHNGSPNVSIDKSALKGIITQSLATEKALAAYANIQAKTQDPNTLVQNESRFRNIPNLIQGYEYGLARNAQEAEEFLKKHGLTRAQMAETRRQIKAFESQ